MKALHKESPKTTLGRWPIQQAVRSPGEPLYTLAEIATRLGVKEGELRFKIPLNEGLRPFVQHGRRNLYRLSDARRWWARFEEAA